MGSFLTGATGTGNSFAAQQAPVQSQDFMGKLAQSEGQLNNVFQGQNNLAGVLQSQMNGGGPSPEMLEAQRMNENAIKSNTGMIASQKGISPAMAARLAAENSAGMQQQAAGQGAMMGMNKQLSVQNALQNLYGTQGNQANTASSTVQNALGAFNNANVGMYSNMNNANQATNAQNAATAGGLVGGLAGGISSAVSSLFAEGGEVQSPGIYKENPKLAKVPQAQRFDSGGAVQPSWGYGMQPSIDSGAANMANKYIAAGGAALEKGISGLFNPMGKSGGGDSGGGSMDGMAMAGGPMDAGGGGGGLGALALLAANGGEIPDHLHHMANLYHPDFGGKLMELKAKGGSVPGKAEVPGNSYKNDTVPAMLSPGEIVLPRTVTQSQDPVKAAADFVAEKLKEKQGSGNHTSDFHDALKRAIGSRRSK
jgi:hypothetical protein